MQILRSSVVEITSYVLNQLLILISVNSGGMYLPRFQRIITLNIIIIIIVAVVVITITSYYCCYYV